MDLTANAYQEVSHNYGSWYPYGIVKIVSPIYCKGTQIWPLDASNAAECMSSRALSSDKSLNGYFGMYHILVNAVPGQSTPFSLNPEDMEEAYIGATKTPKISLTYVIAHELGHAVGLGHDNYLYPCKNEAGNRVKTLHEKMFNAYCHYDNGTYTAKLGLRKSDLKLKRIFIKEGNGSIYEFVEGTPTNMSCGGLQAVNINIWNWVLRSGYETMAELSDGSLFKSPLSVMFTSQTTTDKLTPCEGIPIKNWSYANCGLPEYLNPVSIDANLGELRYKDTPSWDYMNEVYPLSPSTPAINVKETLPEGCPCKKMGQLKKQRNIVKAKNK